MTIRPETVSDYPAIADVTARAFGNRSSEATIIALHRQRLQFDPDLSLVAEEGGAVVGHVLFSPRTVRLMGEDVRAVNLAPIAVDPHRQKSGIGAALIEAGHTVAREKGCAFSFLLGHASYYPRFGYRTRAYGDARVDITGEHLSDLPLEWRALSPGDVPALVDLWRGEEADVDLSVEPDSTFLAWISPNPAIEPRIYVDGDEIAGYVRLHRDSPQKLRQFLAASPARARRIASSLLTGQETLTLPIHPRSRSAAAFPGAVADTWNAAMICPLLPGIVDCYLDEVTSAARPPGRPIWPVEFDLD